MRSDRAAASRHASLVQVDSVSRRSSPHRLTRRLRRVRPQRLHHHHQAPRRHLTDFMPLGAIAPISGLGWSDTMPGGPDALKCTVQVSPGLVQPQALDAGRIVEVWRGGIVQWEGILDQPTPATASGRSPPRARAPTATSTGTSGRRWTDVNTSLTGAVAQPRAAAVETDHLLQHAAVPRRPAAVRHRDDHRPAEPGDQARLLHVAHRPPQPAVDLPRAYRDDPDPVLLEPRGAVAGRVLQRAVRPVPVRR